ncbi:MAG: Lpg1974 family pore-forming outer membrane protein [Chlamydiota bacterium]
MMKKELLLHTVFSLFLLTSTGVNADAPSKSEMGTGLDSRVSILEAQMNEVSTKTVHGNWGAKTASSSPQILGENWFFTADMLWWHVNEGGNDYAVRYKDVPGSPEAKAKDLKLNFKWNWGFRSGIGTTFDHDRWDLYLNFTWFRADNSAAASTHGGPGVIPLLGAPVAGGVNAATQAKIHWNIRFYNLDLNLGRNYFVSSKLALHPFVGLKTGWINQNQHTSAKLFVPVSTNLKTKTDNDFWGIGPNVGLEGKWFIGNCFNLFGSAAGAILWGDFDVHQKQHSSITDSTTYRVDFDLHTVVPMAQMQIGMGYETNIYHNRYRIAVNARYEQQYWWQQNQMPYFPAASTFKFRRFSDDLSLQGLTVDVRFDF